MGFPYLHCYITILLYYYITILLYCYIAILLYCYIAILLYCYITILLYCYIDIYKDRSTSTPKSRQNRPKIDPKSIKNRSRSTKNRAWMGPGGHLGPKVAPGADLILKPDSLDALGPPSLGAKIDQTSSKNRSQTQQVFP